MSKHNPSIVFNVNTGAVFVGRHANNTDRVVRVEGADGPRFVVRHRSTGGIQKMLPTTLFSHFEPVSEAEGQNLFPFDGERVALSVTADGHVPARRRSGAKRKHRSTRTKLEPTTGDVSVKTTEPAPTASEPFAPSPRERAVSAWVKWFHEDHVRDESKVICGTAVPRVVDNGQMYIDFGRLGIIFGLDLAGAYEILFDWFSSPESELGPPCEYTPAIPDIDGMILSLLEIIQKANPPRLEEVKKWISVLSAPLAASAPTPANEAQREGPWVINPRDKDGSGAVVAAVLFGQSVKTYHNPEDGSAWVAGQDIAHVFRAHRPKVYAWLGKAGETNARKVPWLLKEGLPTTDKWMARATYLEANLPTLLPYIVREAKAAEPAPPAPTVEPSTPLLLAENNEEPEVIEEGISIPEGMMLATFGGVLLAVPGGESGEARVRDITLGEKLELARPRTIRDTIREMQAEGLLPGVLDRRQQRRSRNRYGEADSASTVTEFWLTEEETLKVIMRSKSPVAYRIVDEMIAVYRAWRHGRLPSALQSEEMKMLSQTVRAVADISKSSLLVAQEAAKTAMETRAMLEKIRHSPTVDAEKAEQDARDAETLRKQRANAAAKGAATKGVNAVRREVQDVLRPVIHQFFSERMIRADLRDLGAVQRCLRPSEVMVIFNAFLRANVERIGKEELDALNTIGQDAETRSRVIYGMFNEASHHVKVEKEIVDEDGVRRMATVLPWYPKISLASDPRQTTIPGSGR